MEFFRIIDVNVSESEIHSKLKLSNLESYCESMFPMEDGDEACMTGGMFGEFTVRRDEIIGGVRFSMLDCPNALAWTITTGYPPARDKVVIHMTINRERKPEDFVNELRQFLEDLQSGLKSFFG